MSDAMIADAIIYLRSLSIDQAMVVFWFLFIFDIPRYTISVFSLIFTDIVSPFFRRNLDNGVPLDTNTKISVLLVGHNEAEKLERSVASIEEQTMNDVEIIVVDDGSSDNMSEVGKKLESQGRISRFITTDLRGGKAAALNLGFSHCTRDIVVGADIDTTFDRDAFFKITQPFRDPNVGAVSGNIGVRNSEKSILASQQAIQYIISISLGRQFLQSLDALPIVSGGFGAFRRKAVDAVGGWDVGPGDDSNLTGKLRVARWRIAFAQHAWALTDVPVNFKGFFNQRMRWNRSVIRNRLRKFRVTLNPFHRNFRTQNVLSAFNVLFFHVLLSWTFFIHQFWLVYTFGFGAIVFIIVIILIYTVEDFLVYSYAHLKFRERGALWLYLPSFVIFKSYILRSIRAIAYIDELVFRRSYQDEFYPTKVRRQVYKF